MKNYITGIITGISLTASAVMFMGAKMQNDLIVAKKITLVDKDGKPTMILDGEKGRINALQFTIIGFDDNNDAKIAGTLKSGKNAQGYLNLFNNGGILIKDDKDIKSTYLASTGLRIRDEENLTKTDLFSSALTIDVKEKEAISIGLTDPGGGRISINNSKNQEVIYLGSNSDSDGLIQMFDRYGDFGWNQSGKRR